MKLQKATHDDVVPLIFLLRQMFIEAPSRHQFEFDVVETIKQGCNWIDNTDYCCLCLKNEADEYLGVFVGVMNQYVFAPTMSIACEVVLYVIPEARKGRASKMLIDGFEEWAKQKGAKELNVSASDTGKDEIVARMYKRHGFAVTGCYLSKQL
jgi:GNAT superfamily N-acetyltransferase